MDGPLAPHFCTSCGRPQPVSAGEDYFTAFRLSRRFAVDRAAIEKRFYELSRILHPDRFLDSSIYDLRQLSLERMSFLNQAWNTLKNPEELRDYLLVLEKVALPQIQAPVELAEAWFEIQDAVVEAPATAAATIAEFEKQLRVARESVLSEMIVLERRFDDSPNGAFLVELGKLLQTRNYLKSLERDVQRLREKTGLS